MIINISYNDLGPIIIQSCDMLLPASASALLDVVQVQGGIVWQRAKFTYGLVPPTTTPICSIHILLLTIYTARERAMGEVGTANRRKPASIDIEGYICKNDPNMRDDRHDRCKARCRGDALQVTGVLV